jgi:hypothetical protein
VHWRTTTLSDPAPSDDPPDVSGNAARRIRLPGFVRDEEVGLGDVVKRVTYAFGIKPCGGCEARAAAMNRWMSFAK